MGESSTNILNLPESVLNSLKKSVLVQKILDLKGTVVIGADLHKLCEKTERLTESMNQTVAENKKLQSDIAIQLNLPIADIPIFFRPVDVPYSTGSTRKPY